MDDYLPKPVRPGELADVLARLGHRRWSDQAVPGGQAEHNGSVRPGSALEPAVDPAVLDGLLDQLGDAGPATRRAVLDNYVSQGTGWIEELVTAAHAGDGETIGRVAHTLRSSSQVVGALRLATLLREAEQASRIAGTDLVPYACSIETEYHRVAAALAAMGTDAQDTREHS
jgi:HPt (histidine-containing phosphotransfer) domain-containing protein